MRLTTLCKRGWGPVRPRGPTPETIKLLHLDQATAPMYRRADPWVVGGEAQRLSNNAWNNLGGRSTTPLSSSDRLEYAGGNLQRFIDVGNGVGKGNAALLCCYREMENTVLNQSFTVSHIEGRVIVYSDVTPTHRCMIHEVYDKS